MRRLGLVVSVLALLCWVSSASAALSDEELRGLVQSQQAQIEELKARLAALESAQQGTATRIQITEQQLDSAVAALESGGGAGATAEWTSRTRIGGYGEMHYNDLGADDKTRDLEEIDYHRFVLFFGHDFSDRLKFFSEFELEHALASRTASGEIELEQAYIEYAFSDALRGRAGMVLLPIGILNETHEPPTFYGVERNDVENIIIPSTWWEGGGGLSAEFDSGLGVDFALHSGLRVPVTGANAFRVRSGRQKVNEAVASDFAYTGRIRYHLDPGLDLALSVQYQSDASQEGGDGLDDGWLTSASLAWQRSGFGLRGLYSRWDFSGDAVEAAGVDEQTGWYLEPSYRFPMGFGDLGVYVRYEDVEGARTVDRFNQWEVGMNYWPHPSVVFKVDLRQREHDEDIDNGRDFEGIDLGLGYQF